jgi:ABC-2 type transport system ATP-binding protein
MKAVLRIRDLRIGKGTQPRLEGVDLELYQGDRLGLLGPNGAGKSSLLLAIAGLLHPHAGEITIDGDPQVAARRRQVGFLPQRVPIYPELTVREHLAWCGALQRLHGRELDACIDRTLDQVCLADQASSLAGCLSAGMQQRLGLAQALLHGPRLLLLDEPTASLDPAQMTDIRKLIGTLPDTVCVILATHLFDDVYAVCKRVAVLDGGCKIDDRPVEQDMDLMRYFDAPAAGVR